MTTVTPVSISNGRAADRVVEHYLDQGADFINDAAIESKIAQSKGASAARVREIIAKAKGINTLTADETAVLLNTTDENLWHEMEKAAAEIKHKVYDNRIVTFAPLYCSTACVNDCLYCGLRSSNTAMRRSVLSLDAVKQEVEVLAGTIGHKRLVAVYGEHPSSGVDYMVKTLETIYSVRTRGRHGDAAIRRVNVNAAPLSVSELRTLNGAGIGTYQVFQETYHRATYRSVHPASTIKGDYQWRLYCMHRALEAGIDDVGIGSLFGLYDWRFEVMGLLYHAIELEKRYGIGPHTVSFPRLEPAESTPFAQSSKYLVSDAEFRKAIVVLRLAIPYAGMILTAREDAKLRRELIGLGITQTDASSKIGPGAYHDSVTQGQVSERQQFILGDTRSLDDVVRDLAQMGYITSFCTAGYRCGRTGECIMDLLRTGAEGKFCKLNAVITFKEWLDDFASPETQRVGQPIIDREISELKVQTPKVFDSFMEFYNRTANGERDLYF